MNRPALTPLELRPERVHRTTDARLQFSKCLYDGRTILKEYLEGKQEVYLHTSRTIVTDGNNGCTGLCIRFSRTNAQAGAVNPDNQSPVLVLVREKGKGFRPVNSIVRL